MNNIGQIYFVDYKFYNRAIKKHNIITQTHLISILMYFDLFQKAFTQTRRKTNINEINNNLIQTRSNFYWLGRKLYEQSSINNNKK